MTSPVKGSTFAIHNFSTTTLTFMLSMLLCQSLSAQVPQKASVARLVVNAGSDATNSRPRLVGAVPAIAGEPSSSSPSFSDATTAEKNSFSRTNQARQDNGLPLLVWDPYLCRLARAHSENMARQGYFSHETPEGLQLKDRARAMGILHFKVIGENIAYNKGYDDPGAFAVERWMSSGGHRANMLYPGFQSSAIGSYVSSDGSVYLTQVFITR